MNIIIIMEIIIICQIFYFLFGLCLIFRSIRSEGLYSMKDNIRSR